MRRLRHPIVTLTPNPSVDRTYELAQLDRRGERVAIPEVEDTLATLESEPCRDVVRVSDRRVA